MDAGQGVQAQTMANFFLAFGANLHMVPIITKIDLSTADVFSSLEQMQNVFEIQPDSVLQVSAKTGVGMDQVIPAIIERIPP